jgi:AcrR family transcriptional regulator
MDGLRERKSARARTATLDAGFRLFAERGYDEVTVADICAAAEIGRRTFFHYFPGKEDLLESPVRDMTAHLTATLGQAPPAATDGQALRAAMADLAMHALAHRSRLDVYRRIIAASATLRLPVFGTLSGHELRLARQLKARHSASGPVDLDTRLLVARAVAAFRVWLDVTLDSTSAILDSATAGSSGQAPEGEATMAAAQRLFDRIFDGDPLLAA